MDIKSDAPKTEIQPEVVETQYMPLGYAIMKSYNSKPVWQGLNTFNILFNMVILMIVTNPHFGTIVAMVLGIIAVILNVAIEYNQESKKSVDKLNVSANHREKYKVDWEYPMDKVYR